jgi:hypothetical protein
VAGWTLKSRAVQGRERSEKATRCAPTTEKTSDMESITGGLNSTRTNEARVGVYGKEIAAEINKDERERNDQIG